MNDNSKKTNRLIESGKVVDHNQRVESVLAVKRKKLKTCLQSDLSGVPLAPAPAPTPAISKSGGSWYDSGTSEPWNEPRKGGVFYVCTLVK